MVLDEEKPDANGRGDVGDGDLDEEKGFKADGPNGYSPKNQDAQVCPIDAASFFFPALALGYFVRNAVADCEGEEGGYANEKEGVAIETIGKALPFGELKVLVYGPGVNIADTTQIF